MTSTTGGIHHSTGLKSVGNLTETNFPTDGEGRVYHLALKKTELANDIIIVGEPNRASIVASYLDRDPSIRACSLTVP